MNGDPVYFLDTSVAIRLLRRRPSEILAVRVKPLIEGQRAIFNDVVRAELLIGCKTDGEQSLVREWLAGLTELKVKDDTWDRAADLGFHLRRKGVNSSLPDLLIAASAVETGAVVMHVDGDFDFIAKHSDLRVESYVEAEI